MSITDEGHYGPKQLNLLKTVWGEGFLLTSPHTLTTDSFPTTIHQTSLTQQSIPHIPPNNI